MCNQIEQVEEQIVSDTEELAMTELPKKKRKIWIPIALLVVVLIAAVTGLYFSGFFMHKEEVALVYGDTYSIDMQVYNNPESLAFTSDSVEIADVVDGVITAIGPGEATITASLGERVVGEYNVTVTIVPITSIVFSTNNIEVVEEKTVSLSYELFPQNASPYMLSWKSADETVAQVDDNGEICGVTPGQTTVILSTPEGIVETCEVIVKQKPAYERLTQEEKEFVDWFLLYIDSFYMPSSVEVLSVISGTCTLDQETYYLLTLRAQNGYGGNGIERYVLSAEDGLIALEGFVEDYRQGKISWQEFNSMRNRINALEVNDIVYNSEIINEAIQEQIS